MKNNIKNKQITLLLFSIMLIIGFVGNLRGVLLPSIKQSLGISYSDIGLMIFITSLGYFTSTFIGGFIGDKIGQKKILAFGFIVVTIGLIAIFYTRSFLLLILTMLILNIGMGCFDIGLNSLAPKIFIANTAVMMSMMHVFFGLGSAASPKLASWMLSKSISWNSIYLCSLVLIAGVFIFFIFSPMEISTPTKSSIRLPLSSLLKDRRIWLFIGVFGFCEATEVGISTWLINFLQVVRGLSKGSSAQYMFYFFIIYTIGRIFGGYIAEKLGYVKTVITFIIMAILLLICGILLGGSCLILFSLTGFFISIMYPTMVTIIAKEYPQGLSSISGVVMTAAGLMSVAANWIIGRLSDKIGVLPGFAIIPVYAAIAAALLIILKRYLIYDIKTRDKSIYTN